MVKKLLYSIAASAVVCVAYALLGLSMDDPQAPISIVIAIFFFLPLTLLIFFTLLFWPKSKNASKAKANGVKMKKKAKQKGLPGYKLAAIGAAILILPMVLATLDAALGISEGANIGLGIFFIFAAPVGFILILVGLIRELVLKLKK